MLESRLYADLTRSGGSDGRSGGGDPAISQTDGKSHLDCRPTDDRLSAGAVSW